MLCKLIIIVNRIARGRKSSVRICSVYMYKVAWSLTKLLELTSKEIFNVISYVDIYILKCRVKDGYSGLLRQNLKETLETFSYAYNMNMHKVIYGYIGLNCLVLPYIYSYIWLLQRQLEVPFIFYQILLKC